MGMDESLFEFEEMDVSNPTDLKVLGVGGGGNNAVHRMNEVGIRGVEFVAVNTDAQDLNTTEADRKLQIGEEITQGLGSGGDPKVGMRAAQESREDIQSVIEGTDLLFLTAGMGGGTGTGASPVIAELSREMDVLTIGVVTRPFQFEGKKRARRAEAGIQSLRDHLDTLIVVPNQRIYDVIEPEDIAFERAFMIADEVLYHGVHGISEVIMEEGIINLDFADVRTVMQEKGDALMGIGEASGENAALEAGKRALDCPLLETNDITGARGLLIHINGAEALTPGGVQEVMDLVNEKADPEAEVFVGPVRREDMNDRVRVTVIATGFPSGQERGQQSQSQNVVDVNQISDKQIDRPAYERKQEQGTVEVVESDPDDAENPTPQDENDLSVPAFMRVK